MYKNCAKHIVYIKNTKFQWKTWRDVYLLNFRNELNSKSIKGYLRYKTISSQNVPSEPQIKNFLFRRKVMFRSQDFQVFVFLTIP